MKRIPSEELVRFLLSRWAFEDRTVAEISRECDTLAAESWAGFSASELKEELSRVANDVRHAQRKIRDFAKPCVLCLFDDGQQGKSTFANLLKHQGIPVFATDSFVADLATQPHDNEPLRQLAKLHHPSTVDQFIEKVQSSLHLGQAFLNVFFQPTFGFTSTAAVSVIEGFLHHPHRKNPVAIRLDEAIEAQLRKRGYKVWVAQKSRQS